MERSRRASMIRLLWIGTLVTGLLASSWAFAFADDEVISVEVTTTQDCYSVDFEAAVDEVNPAYSYDWAFGDGATQSNAPLASHNYDPPAVDTDYTWVLSVEDTPTTGHETPNSGEDTGEVTMVAAPVVTLTADETRIPLVDGAAEANFTASVEGGTPPYVFDWEFPGASDWEFDMGEASATYTALGEYEVTVTVTDDCVLEDSDTVTIEVVTCHPRAFQIAEAVNTLLPDQATREYTCEQIYSIFRGVFDSLLPFFPLQNELQLFQDSVLGDIGQVGFGRMWHAYNLAADGIELYWENVLGWHLSGNGWGLLLQLDKFAGILADWSLADLIDLVNGDIEVRDIRHAVRMVIRFDADFEDALDRLTEGGWSPGEAGQFFRLAQELGIDSAELDAVLGEGAGLSDVRHAAKVGERQGSDWDEILTFRLAGHSWGAIGQAYRLAGEEGSTSTAEEILGIGVHEYRSQQREDARALRDANRAAAQAERAGARTDRQADRDARTAERLAEKNGVTPEEVLALYDGTCQQDWKCVRDELRNEAPGGGKP